MCNYSEYKKIISEEIGEKIPTGKEIDRVGEIARRYFVDGGAGGVLVALGVGVRVITKEYFTKELNETISRRLCFVSGGRAGDDFPGWWRRYDFNNYSFVLFRGTTQT